MYVWLVLKEKVPHCWQEQAALFMLMARRVPRQLRMPIIGENEAMPIGENVNEG
jgi:hypothetical protein